MIPIIPASEFDAYNRAIMDMTEEARGFAVQNISEWIKANPNQSVAEIREYAKNLMDGLAQVYGDAASSLAAQWYDEQTDGLGLKRAVIEQTYSRDEIDKVAHYQAEKLKAGKYDMFAASCGEYMANHVRSSANKTMLKNASRDRGKVRFARVPTGMETCTFCMMLASRGAVYSSPQAAGAQNHFHRGCDCKIVPAFAGEKTPVEGYDKTQCGRAWKRFMEIDKMTGEDGKPLSKQVKDELKRRYLAENAMRSPDSVFGALDRLARFRAGNGLPGPPVAYEKPVEDFDATEDGRRDLKAHEVLRKAGHAVVARAEKSPEGYSNIDLLLDGWLCELKSATSSGTGRNGSRFVERNMRKAIKQFRKTFGGPTRPVVIVINTSNTGLPAEASISRAKLEMSRHDVDRLILIDGESVILDIKKSQSR